jgi:hypothetical protein
VEFVGGRSERQGERGRDGGAVRCRKWLVVGGGEKSGPSGGREGERVRTVFQTFNYDNVCFKLLKYY